MRSPQYGETTTMKFASRLVVGALGPLLSFGGIGSTATACGAIQGFQRHQPKKASRGRTEHPVRALRRHRARRLVALRRPDRHADARQAGAERTDLHAVATVALCSPTRSTLLTGRNQTVNGMAAITEGANGFSGSSGRMTPQATTVAQIHARQIHARHGVHADRRRSAPGVGR